jgi:hypothetical protein
MALMQVKCRFNFFHQATIGGLVMQPVLKSFKVVGNHFTAGKYAN